MRPTLSDIARQLGISKMTVSRALRGAPHVGAEVRERVLHAAQQAGYRPDPEISRLMTHMRKGRAKVSAEKIAFIWAEREEQPCERVTWTRQVLQGAARQAVQLGYDVEEFFLWQRGMSGRRLSSILEARGIRSLILSPLVSRSRGHVSLAWAKFASVIVGLGFARPALHRVHHHHFLGMMTALRMLKKERHRRIGLYCSSILNERMFGAWSACFLAHHPLPRPGGLLALRRPPSREDFFAWLEKEKPEVVIDSGHQLLDWLKELPAADRPALATLSWRADLPQVPGIDQQAESLGEAAVDLLAAQMQQNQRGIPVVPRLVMTEGVWRPAVGSIA
ncbi:MAG: LacI family transcriptional regulator [Prosthecobacter sp.]|nr:LacI family transcriptional regulator [Prosthecobacter sp.]